MPVIDKDYLVGRIVETNYLSSRVLLLNDLNSRIPVTFGDDSTSNFKRKWWISTSIRIFTRGILLQKVV